LLPRNANRNTPVGGLVPVSFPSQKSSRLIQIAEPPVWFHIKKQDKQQSRARFEPRRSDHFLQ
jgi:hypothetical protein